MTLFSILTEPLSTPAEMALWDKTAEEYFSIPTLLLMENAAAAARDVLFKLSKVNNKKEPVVVVLAGKGNNGGDGIALARMLHDDGLRVLVCATASGDTMRSPAKEHAEMARRVGVPFHISHENDAISLPEPWLRPDVVVDAITGTGIHGDLRPRELAMVRLSNDLRDHAFILSLDIPSGLSGLTGKTCPEAVRAHATVCFEAGKPGLFMPSAQEYVGKVCIRRVGIPRSVRQRVPSSWALLDPKKHSLPKPSTEQHKGQAGKVLIIGGSDGMSGAPILAALGSQRTGAGLVHVAMPGPLAAAAAPVWPELMLHPIGDTCTWEEHTLPLLLDLVEKIQPDSIVLGPGLGRGSGTRSIVKAVLECRVRPPLVLDADALFHLRFAQHDNEADSLAAQLLQPYDILTPHPGEMARMIPDSFFTNSVASGSARTAAIQSDRAIALQEAIANCAATVVLKGAGTLIGSKGMPTVLSPYAVAALGVGGSGDVLSGICGTLVASGMPSFEAACLGVHLHARAGQMLSESSLIGHTPRDIANAVPQAWSELWSA